MSSVKHQLDAAQLRLSLTIKEAVRATGISEDILRRAEREGRLPFRYPSTRPVIRLADLDHYIDNCPLDAP